MVDSSVAAGAVGATVVATLHDQQSQLCVICLENLDPSYSNTLESESNSSENYITTNENEVHNLRCGHITHSHCLRESIRSGNYTCPICRQPLGEVPTSSSAAATATGVTDSTTHVEKKLVRYINMLKSKLDPAAVKQRMKVDGIPVATIDAFFTGGMSLEVASPTARENNVPFEVFVLPQKDMEKYRKMLKIGFNEDVIRQKLSAVSGVSAAQVDRVWMEIVES